MKLITKKTFVVLTTICMLAVVPQESYGQGWLKKITQGIDKGFDAVNKGLDNVNKALGGSSTKNSQSGSSTGNTSTQQNNAPQQQTQAPNGEFPVTLAGSTFDGAKNPNVTMVMQSCQRKGNDIYVKYLATNRNANDIRVSILASRLDEKYTIAYDANGKKHRMDFVYNDNKFNTRISEFVDITLPHGITAPILMIIKDVDVSIKKMARVSIAFNRYMYSLDNVPITEPVVATTQQNQDTQKTFILQNGVLGPVQVGRAIGNLPKQYAGLYDNYSYTKDNHEEDEMDGPWLEEFFLFTKAGKEIFRADMNEGKVASITLLSGSSSFIKTPEGIYVGYPAQKLYREKKMEWEYYLFETVTWGTSGHYTYYVDVNDAITDNMDRLKGFKANGKLCKIANF